MWQDEITTAVCIQMQLPSIDIWDISIEYNTPANKLLHQGF